MTWVSRSGSARISGTWSGRTARPPPPLAEQLGRGAHRIRDQRPHVDVGVVPLGMPGLDLRHVEHLVDQAAQPLALRDDDPQELLALPGLHVGRVQHQLGQGADRGQRRAKLVGHRGHEVVLQVVEALQLLVGGAQLGGRRLERARLFLERARIAAQLRRLVEDLDHVVDRQRLLLHHRGDHDPGRCAAHGAGELPLDAIDEARIRDHLPTSATPVSRACSSNSCRPGLRRADGSRAPSGPRAGRGRARRPARPRRARPRSNTSTKSSAWLASRAEGARHSDRPT